MIGDAAHTIHPLAGQGVNLGFQDVGALVDVLVEGRAGRIPLGDLDLLRRYQRRRQTDNLKMSAAMEGFKRLFMPQSPWLEWGRSVGMNLADRSGPIKHHLIAEAMGLNSNSSSLLKVSTLV